MNILDLVFPKNCLNCGKGGKYICEDCLARVGKGGISKDHISIFRYEGVIRKAIIALKYKYSTEIAKELAEICVRKLIANHYPLIAILVPVPLHWYRKNFRGFNQSEEVGRLIAKGMAWDFIPDLLIKKRSTTSQVELKGSARRQNLRGVFGLNPNYSLIPARPAGGAIRYPLIIFDDVFTTGSTLKEAAKVLKRGGVEEVWGLTIAR